MKRDNNCFLGGISPEDYALSQLNIMANAQASPVCLGFNVTPSEFKPGTAVTLYAQAVNPLDGSSLDGVHVQFLQDGNSTIGPVLSTNSDGVASWGWTYPSSGSVCTVLASVIPDTPVGNCSLAVQPVTLTVGAETRLLLSAWRDPGSTGHTIYAGVLDAAVQKDGHHTPYYCRHLMARTAWPYVALHSAVLKRIAVK